MTQRSSIRPSTARRRFLRLLVALSAAVPVRTLLAVPQARSSRRVAIRALNPYLDTLLPGDLTPGATQLGADRYLLEWVGENPQTARLVVLGCEWLDKQARERGVEDFAVLDESSREAVVATAEQSPVRSLPRMFFTSTRDAVFRYYYAQPESWQGLGYGGPPQPLGFPDHARPPAAQKQWPKR